MSAIQPANTQMLPSFVRNWVHYDNLATKYSKEASAARKMRDDYEGKIVGYLKANKMENATIQIADGRLQCAEEKQVPSLTMPRLEEYLHDYFKKKGNYVDETESILRFIKQQKAESATVCTRLRKTPAPVTIPGPMGPIGGSA